MKKVTPDDLVRDLHIVAEDLEALVQAASHDASTKVTGARDRAAQLLRTIKHRLKEAEKYLEEKAQVVATEADTYVRNHAWETIAAAAKAGIVVGLMMHERKRTL